ncbi:MAG: arsenate reductase ArsC [Thaumarchaeota archaeon]|nr:arsenate reductase ArsC [Nitrososphaerota archaeon]
MKKLVMFVCVGNAGRSQMAEAFAKKYGGDKIEAVSAGTLPAKHVHPEVSIVMKEKGIDISKNTPKIFDVKMADKAAAIITMGCSVEGLCPAPMLKKTVDWKLEDPKGKPMEKIREIRDDIEQRVIALLEQLV